MTTPTPPPADQPPPPANPTSRHPRDGYRPHPDDRTSAEAAVILDVSTRSLEKWRKNGKGPVYQRFDGYWIFYRVADLEEYQRARRAVVTTADAPAPAPDTTGTAADA